MWAMLMVPDPSLRLQAWIAPGWVESMPSVFPFPFFRVFCWIVYMSLASTAWEVNQRTDLGWRVLGLLGPVVCFGLIVFRGYEWGSMWCHFASLIVTLYLVAPWFENWRRRVGGRAPGKGCLVNTFAEFTEPSFVNAGWEHIYGWKEIPAMTARGIVPFGPDYRNENLWRPVWPTARSFVQHVTFPGFVVTTVHATLLSACFAK